MTETQRLLLFEKYFQDKLKTFVNYLKPRLDNLDEAEDVAQKAMINVWNGLPGLKEPRYINTWGYRVMRNTLLNHYREKSKQSSVVINVSNLISPITGEDPVKDYTIEEHLDGLNEKNNHVPNMDPHRSLCIRAFETALSRAVGRLKKHQKVAVNNYLMNSSRGRGLIPITTAEKNARSRGLMNLSLALKKKKDLLYA